MAGIDIVSKGPRDHSAQGNSRVDYVQGLRAVAVVSVVLFHLGDLLPGGFVGVDIFFVLSGYVVARSTLGLVKAGKFHVVRFLERRARRLLPALAVVTCSCLVLFACTMPPDPLWISARTAFTAQFFSSNFDIARTTGDYFSGGAHSNGFLHYWSLSLEEQFFVLFPFFVVSVLASRQVSKAGKVLIGIGFSASITLAMVPLLRSSALPQFLSGYYSPVPRLWQFLVGVAIASMSSLRRELSGNSTRVLTSLGAVALFASLFFAHRVENYPNWTSLLPTLGTAAVLWPSEGNRSGVRSLLAKRPFRLVGNASYVLYLWHWPFLVAANSLTPHSKAWVWVFFAASLVPTYLTHHFVEFRFMEPSLRSKRRAKIFLIGSLTIIPLVASAAVYIPARAGVVVPSWLGTAESMLEGSIGNRDFFRTTERVTFNCDDPITWKPLTFDGFNRCKESKPNIPVSVALIGDSHAEHLFSGIAELGGLSNVGYYIAIDGPLPVTREMTAILDYVTTNINIETIVVSSAWSRGRHEDERFTEVLRALMRSDKQVFVVGDVPEFPFDAFYCKYQVLFFERRCSSPGHRFLSTNQELGHTLREVGLPQSNFIDLAPLFCHRSEFCQMSRSGSVLYRDSNHLNVLGSKEVASLLISRSPSLREALGL